MLRLPFHRLAQRCALQQRLSHPSVSSITTSALIQLNGYATKTSAKPSKAKEAAGNGSSTGKKKKTTGSSGNTAKPSKEAVDRSRSFQKIIKDFREATKSDDVEVAWSILQDQAVPQKFHVQAEDLSALLRLLAKHGDVNRATQLFSHIRKYERQEPDRAAHESLILACAKRAEMTPSPKLITIALKNFETCIAKQEEAASELRKVHSELQRLQKSGKDDEVAVDTEVSAQLRRRKKDLYGETRAWQIGTFTFNELLRCLIRCDVPKQALQLYDTHVRKHMVAKAKRLQEDQEKQKQEQQQPQSQGKQQQQQQQQKDATEFDSNWIQPDGATFSMLITALSRSSAASLESVFSLIDDIRMHNTVHSKHMIILDSYIYNSLLRACSDKSTGFDGLQLALTLYRQMLSDGTRPTIHTYNILMQLVMKNRVERHSSSESSDESLVLRIWREMEQQGVQADSHLLNLFAQLLARDGFLQLAIRDIFVNSLTRRFLSVTADTCSILVKQAWRHRSQHGMAQLETLANEASLTADTTSSESTDKKQFAARSYFERYLLPVLSYVAQTADGAALNAMLSSTVHEAIQLATKHTRGTTHGDRVNITFDAELMFQFLEYCRGHFKKEFMLARDDFELLERAFARSTSEPVKKRLEEMREFVNADDYRSLIAALTRPTEESKPAAEAKTQKQKKAKQEFSEVENDERRPPRSRSFSQERRTTPRRSNKEYKEEEVEERPRAARRQQQLRQDRQERDGNFEERKSFTRSRSLPPQRSKPRQYNDEGDEFEEDQRPAPRRQRSRSEENQDTRREGNYSRKEASYPPHGRANRSFDRQQQNQQQQQYPKRSFSPQNRRFQQKEQDQNGDREFDRGNNFSRSKQQDRPTRPRSSSGNYGSPQNRRFQDVIRGEDASGQQRRQYQGKPRSSAGAASAGNKHAFKQQSMMLGSEGEERRSSNSTRKNNSRQQEKLE